MKRLILLLLSFNLISAAYAYELHGTMDDNNDGTYTVNLSSDTGYEYLGQAVTQGDGTLAVNVAVQGGGNETYIGIAKPGPNGTYILSLRNNMTGDFATGTMTEY